MLFYCDSEMLLSGGSRGWVQYIGHVMCFPTTYLVVYGRARPGWSDMMLWSGPTLHYVIVCPD